MAVFDGGADHRPGVIASRSNPTIKWIRALRERKHRERTGWFFVESLRLVAEAVRQNADLRALVYTDEAAARPLAGELVAAQRARGVTCLRVTPEVFDTLSQRDGPEGLGAVVRQRWQKLEDVYPERHLCWVALDAIQHPGNAGTILRACDAAGAGGALLLERTTDPYDPTAVRASLGSIFSQGLVRCSFADFATWTRRRGVRVVGTSPGADRDYREVLYRRPAVLLMGCERSGLPPDHQALCDAVVRIPMLGQCDSLNVAVAASLLLYETLDQRQRAR